MGGNIHFSLEYEVTDVVSKHLGLCTIVVKSTYPGYPSGMTLSHSCDESWLRVVEEKDGQEQATFTFTSRGLLYCPAGLELASAWKIENQSGRDMVIATLAGWNRTQRVFEKFDAKIDTYLGSDSYKLAVSNTTVGDKHYIYVQTCTSKFGSTEPDGSLYLAYRLNSPETQAGGPPVLIYWSGTGKVAENGSKEYHVNEDDGLITIVGDDD